MHRKSTVTDEQILVVLLESMTLEKAAAALDISTTTLWRRSRTLAFRRKYCAARAEAFEENLACLARAAQSGPRDSDGQDMADPERGASGQVQAAICAYPEARRHIRAGEYSARYQGFDGPLHLV